MGKRQWPVRSGRAGHCLVRDEKEMKMPVWKDETRTSHVMIIVLSGFAILFIHNMVVQTMTRHWADAGFALAGLILVLPTPSTRRLMAGRPLENSGLQLSLQQWLTLVVLALSAVLKLFVD